MYAAFHVYEVPSFPEDSVGIFVARFGGDPHDRYQRLFEKSLGDVISEKRLGERHQLVKALPRRIHSAAEARRLGADAGAAAVLWGNLFDDAFASEPALEAKVTFAAAAGFFDEAGDAPIKGAEALSSGARNLSISGELGTLQSVLPLLLAGYRVYHSAADTIGYLRASTYFDSTLARMESIQTRDASSPIKAVLATVHFYLGNTHYVLGDVERAEDSYRKAIELSQGTEGGIRPEYVEPLSNLGHLLSDQKRYEDAVAVLARADVQCSVDTTTPVCAYAFYNHGSALLELADYRDALARFRRAAERIESAGARGDADTAEYRLAAYARQNTAYSAVKLAGETGDSELLDRAQREWEMGAKLMEERVGEQVPDRFRITLARIHIQRREWDQARDLLSRLQRAGLAEPTLFALLAGVNWCMGDTPAFGLAMQRLQSATAHDAAARAAAFREQKTILELCDRKEAEP
jgi:tetratricopeptide (TPR) repeat protein